MTSSITWHPATTPPDTDITVLVHIADGEVWTGFLDADTWRYVSGGSVEAPVLHWADFPQPPQSKKSTKASCKQNAEIFT
jgi:hypothetical protein